MKDLKKDIEEFVIEREWNQFHSPKNLAIGLNIEAAELMEIFQWLKEDECSNLNDIQLNKLKEEIGDVLIFLINLSDKFGLDPVICAKEKLLINKKKYPVDKVKGSAKKYDEY